MFDCITAIAVETCRWLAGIIPLSNISSPHPCAGIFINLSSSANKRYQLLLRPTSRLSLECLNPRPPLPHSSCHEQGVCSGSRPQWQGSKMQHTTSPGDHHRRVWCAESSTNQQQTSPPFLSFSFSLRHHRSSSPSGLSLFSSPPLLPPSSLSQSPSICLPQPSPQILPLLSKSLPSSFSLFIPPHLSARVPLAWCDQRGGKGDGSH